MADGTLVPALGRALGLVGRHGPQEHVRRVPAKQPRRGGGLLGHDDDRVVRFPHSHEGEPYVAVRQRLEGEAVMRSEEHTSELQSPCNLVCRLLLEKKKNNKARVPSPGSAHNSKCEMTS